jgi:hypothetical protein
MKKKVLSVLLCASLMTGILAACGSEEETAPAPAAEVEETVAPAPVEEKQEEAAVTGEALPDPVYYYSFDEADGDAGIQVTAQDKTTDAILAPAADQTIKRVNGVKGEAVYLDGANGLKLTDVNGVGETYTISYWMYASRSANYMPTIQWGNPVLNTETSAQRYNNITWAEWGTDGAATFPCVWSHDTEANDLVNNWPNWAPDTADTMLKKWHNITLVVDETKTASSDSACYAANLYVDGQEITKTDSDGNPVEIVIVPEVMKASDNYDFLVGVNYWDAIFKGAFDEVYVFDQALTAGQALTLYEMGDPNATFEEPDRVVTVTQNEDAIAQIGATDLSNAWWSDWSQTFEIKDGEAKEVHLKNYSDGATTWDNYVVVFTNEASEAHQDPNEAGSADHLEYGVLRADAFGWGYDEGSDEFVYDVANWNTWQSGVMVDADVTLIITREGNKITVDATSTDFNGTKTPIFSAFTSENLNADAPCYFLFTAEHAYVEVLSVADAVIVTPSANALDTLGTDSCVAPFWNDTTDGFELADGATKTVKLKNYTDGVNLWDNFVVAFANVPVTTDKVASADNFEGYAEYAVLRADAFGWGDADFAFTAEKSWEDWDAWTDLMRAADVTLTIKRNGGEVSVDFLFVGRDGKEMTENITFTSTMTADSPVYFFFTNEGSFVELLSVE